MRYRAVFFDAGETLVHPHPSWAELLQATLADGGFEADPDAVLEQLAAISQRFVLAASGKELWSTSPERSRTFWLSVYRDLMEGLGFEYSDPLGNRIYEVFTDVSNYRLFPDALPVLEKLDAAGLVLGLISNFEEWLGVLLESLEVTRFFKAVAISGVEGVEKPDPRIFQLALERAGVTAGQSVYVGDNVVFDVEPAIEAGMSAVLLDRRGRYSDHDGIRITSLDELPQVLGL